MAYSCITQPGESSALQLSSSARQPNDSTATIPDQSGGIQPGSSDTQPKKSKPNRKGAPKLASHTMQLKDSTATIPDQSGVIQPESSDTQPKKTKPNRKGTPKLASSAMQPNDSTATMPDQSGVIQPESSATQPKRTKPNRKGTPKLASSAMQPQDSTATMRDQSGVIQPESSATQPKRTKPNRKGTPKLASSAMQPQDSTATMPDQSGVIQPESSATQPKKSKPNRKGTPKLASSAMQPKDSTATMPHQSGVIQPESSATQPKKTKPNRKEAPKLASHTMQPKDSTATMPHQSGVIQPESSATQPKMTKPNRKGTPKLASGAMQPNESTAAMPDQSGVIQSESSTIQLSKPHFTKPSQSKVIQPESNVMQPNESNATESRCSFQPESSVIQPDSSAYKPKSSFCHSSHDDSGSESDDSSELPQKLRNIVAFLDQKSIEYEQDETNLLPTDCELKDDTDTDLTYSPESSPSSDDEDQSIPPKRRHMIADTEESEMLPPQEQEAYLHYLGTGFKEPRNNSEDEGFDDVLLEDRNTDINNAQIYVRRITTSTTTKRGKRKKSKRVYNTKHSCMYCSKLVTNMSQHLLGVHRRCPEVRKVAKIRVSDSDSPSIRKEKQKERKRLFDVLRIKGDNMHNVKVLQQKRGEMLLSKRPREGLDITHYGPCPNCSEWVKLSVLVRHQLKCVSKDEAAPKMTKGEMLLQSQILSGAVSDKASSALVDEVFTIMKDDRISREAKTDPIIITLGNEWMIQNIGNRLMRKHYVSYVMRLVARLKIQLNQITTPSKGTRLEHYLAPCYFDQVSKAAFLVAKQDSTNEEKLEAPSNLLKLSYYLKRVASIKLANALSRGDDKARKESKDFLRLMNIRFTTKVARVTLAERQYGQKKPLPLPRDIKKLSEYIAEELRSLDDSDHSYGNYTKAVRVVQTKLITFNRRRCGEVQATCMQ